MPSQPRIIYECPNVENTLPLHLFRAQSPARYSQADGDKLVLHAGNSHCFLEIPSADRIKIHHKLHAVGPDMAVFVLDTSVILWFYGDENSGGHRDFGVELPYPSIALHALKATDGDAVLYLQVLSCDVFQHVEHTEYTQTVELVIRPSPENGEKLFTTPLLAKQSSITQMYEALGTCSAFHYDSESDVDTEFGANSAVFDKNHEWITADSEAAPQIEMPASWINSGDADDLGMADNPEDSDGEAGMNVAVEYVTVAGVVRRRASFSEDSHKQRRIS